MAGPYTPTGGSKVATVLRVTSGNFLEMFDFFLFGFYASYISKAFFPTGNEFASLMLTFMTFGAGFLMRPLGAIFLGAYVDRIGRRQGLITTLGIMALGTILIAFVPCYADHRPFRPLPGFDRAAAAGVFGRRRTRRRLRLSRRDGDTRQQGLLRRLGSPGSQQVAVMAAAIIGYVLNLTLTPAEHGRLGLAHPVLHRLRHRAVPFLHPHVSRGDRGVPEKKYRPTTREVFRTLVREHRQSCCSA